jgi:solute:Na+ symporter, SSS family
LNEPVATQITLTGLDWSIIIGYCLLALGIGIYFSKRASKSISEFFVAGGKLKWWIAGTSIVATTFAADTPLLVSGLIRKGGIFKNWIWWNFLFGGMLCTFFFAKMWRRAKIVTDNEFIELRYDGAPASVLRGFMAIHGGVLRNAIVMGWVIAAMNKVCAVLLGLEGGISAASLGFFAKLLPQSAFIAQNAEMVKAEYIVIPVLLLIAGVYSIMSGFWGVVMTDMIQFAMAMGGSILLAVIVINYAGGPAALAKQVAEAPGVKKDVFDFVPSFAMAGKLVVFTFLVNISMAWWGKGQGDGYIVQRLFSCQDEKHSFLASLWFNFAHYVLRPWPWIIVGLASLVYFPLSSGIDPEKAYPMMIAKFLPEGWRGLMVASLLAAFMSTMDTQMNWGASYLINDLYKRFFVKSASARHYVFCSRLAMVLLLIIGAFGGFMIGSIEGAWKFLVAVLAGAGLVSMARWYWWRINAWSELSAMITSFVLATGGVWINFVLKVWYRIVNLLMPMPPPDGLMSKVDWFYSGEAFGVRLVCIVVISTAVWIMVTFMTPPISREKLIAFYRRVRPGGWWGPIAEACPEVKSDSMVPAFIGWISGSLSIFAGLFGVGFMCLGRYGTGTAWLSGSILMAIVMFKLGGGLDSSDSNGGGSAVEDQSQDRGQASQSSDRPEGLQGQDLNGGTIEGGGG